jgi:hypothetical protein
MPNLYYRISDPNDVRDLGEQMAAWVAAGNPKADDWAVQPAAPSDDAVWQDGAWSVPPAPTMTAEEAVSQYFSAYQIAALQRLEMALLQAGKPLGPKMTACKQWLETVMLSWAANPTPAPAEAFGVPQGGLESFAEASGEAVAALQAGQNPET